MLKYWTLRIRMMKTHAVVVALAALLLGSAGMVWAGEPDPLLKPNDSWITISGRVASVEANSFMLDYGDGRLRVEMDDGDHDADAQHLLVGDKVTVSGRIDDDFFEKTEIEAGSVYVEALDTTFFSSSLNKEDWGIAESNSLPRIPHARMLITGTVVKVNQSDFLIDTGERMLRVDVSELPLNPLDDEGHLKIDEGDRVKILGQIEVSLFKGRKLVADTVVEIQQG